MTRHTCEFDFREPSVDPRQLGAVEALFPPLPRLYPGLSDRLGLSLSAPGSHGGHSRNVWDLLNAPENRVVFFVQRRDPCLLLRLDPLAQDVARLRILNTSIKKEIQKYTIKLSKIKWIKFKQIKQYQNEIKVNDFIKLKK